MKFRVGDIITGKKSADSLYTYTNSKAIMKVVGMDAYEISVCVISHETMEYCEWETYHVNPEHFTLIKSVAKSNYI